MNGKKQKIKDIIPVTTTKAVYIDGTNKTLQEAIDNGELGGNTEVITTSSFITNAYLRCNSAIFSIDRITKDITVSLDNSYPISRMVDVIFSNGTVANYSLPINGFTIKQGEYAIIKNGNFEITTNSKIEYNTILVAYNHYGRITGGILANIFARKYDNKGYKKVRHLDMEEIPKNPSNLTLHSMITYNDKLICLECKSIGSSSVINFNTMEREKTFITNFTETNSSGEIVELRMVAADYKYNALLFGNSISSGVLDGHHGYICYEIDKWFDSTDDITFENCGKYTYLDFSPIIQPETGIGGAKLCWGERDDIIYFAQKDLLYCHKILLGKGDNILEYGTRDSDSTKTYNGTYSLIKTYYNENYELGGSKDLQYINGSIIHPIKYVKGGLRIHRAFLNDITNTIDIELLIYDPVNSIGEHTISGSPEGITLYNNEIYVGHTTNYLYKFNLLNLI